MNTLPHKEQLGPQPLDRLRQLPERAKQAWFEAPAWVRSPAAIAGCVALLVIGLLVALALVVQGMVQQGEQLNQAWSKQQYQPQIATPVVSAKL